MKTDFLKKLVLFILLFMAVVGGIVAFFDPFFHYHAPIGPLKAVASKWEYQVIGSLKNFDYDALIAGSSVAQNYNSRWFDESFDCRTVKAVKQAANTADLMYLLEEALQEQELTYIFYSLDLSALTSPRRESFVTEGMPLYLYNENPFDDIRYLFNKDVLMEDIPYMLAHSFVVEYDEGEAYDWSEGKNFEEMHYDPTTEQAAMKAEEEYRENVAYNISLLENLIAENKDISFKMIIPPYSSLWWYEAYMKGETEENFYALEQVIPKLLAYDNVELFYFQNIEEIVANLSLYMDTLHFHPDINRYMAECLVTKEHRLTEENYREELDKMRELYDTCLTVHAPEYFAGLEG